MYFCAKKIQSGQEVNCEKSKESVWLIIHMMQSLLEPLSLKSLLFKKFKMVGKLQPVCIDYVGE